MTLNKIIKSYGWAFILLYSGNSIANESIRVATFNVSMDATNYIKRGETGQGHELDRALSSGSSQIKNIAEIIQRNSPDIILLNEFDYDSDAPAERALTFIKDYLLISQNGQTPQDYPYFYTGPVNTGVRTTFDLDNNGKAQGNFGDAYGFGHFPGHYGMLMLSKYPLDEKNIKTFQLFKWQDMPNALLPEDPTTKLPWYSDDELAEFRLSSKSFWDIPVFIGNKIVHVLASHPTPPVFDGDEDRNGKRNHDEIRMIKDYVEFNNAGYLYDDKQVYGGLPLNSRFVILGDLNASSESGSAIASGIRGLLDSPTTNDNHKPVSAHGLTQSDKNAAYYTASWNMRADYVVPSSFGLDVKASGIYWPKESEDTYRLIKDRTSSSDHRLVWMDLTLTDQ